MKRLAILIGTLILFSLTGQTLAWEQYQQIFYAQGAQPASNAFFIEQRQWPAGYGIKINTPNRRTADIQISVEVNSIFIHMAKQEHQASPNNPGQVFTHFDQFSHWLTLPADANMSQLKVTSSNHAINIFVPRRW